MRDSWFAVEIAALRYTVAEFEMLTFADTSCYTVDFVVVVAAAVAADVVVGTSASVVVLGRLDFDSS